MVGYWVTWLLGYLVAWFSSAWTRDLFPVIEKEGLWISQNSPLMSGWAVSTFATDGKSWTTTTSGLESIGFWLGRFGFSQEGRSPEDVNACEPARTGCAECLRSAQWIAEADLRSKKGDGKPRPRVQWIAEADLRSKKGDGKPRPRVQWFHKAGLRSKKADGK